MRGKLNQINRSKFQSDCRSASQTLIDSVVMFINRSGAFSQLLSKVAVHQLLFTAHGVATDGGLL